MVLLLLLLCYAIWPQLLTNCSNPSYLHVAPSHTPTEKEIRIVFVCICVCVCGSPLPTAAGCTQDIVGATFASEATRTADGTETRQPHQCIMPRSVSSATTDDPTALSFHLFLSLSRCPCDLCSSRCCYCCCHRMKQKRSCRWRSEKCWA